MRPTGVLAAAIIAVDWSMADFTTSFENITSGSTVPLTWHDVPPEHYPLSITAQVIDRSGDGFSANAYRVNLTTDASGTSFTWTGAPYPLRWIPGGLYQLELRPATWDGPDVPLLAKSPYFSISAAAPPAVDPGGSASPQPTAVDSSDGGSGINMPVAIGVGVAVGVPSVVATGIVTYCLRKRQRRAAMEKRRLKRTEFVIS